MHFFRQRPVFVLILICICMAFAAHAKVNPALYGLPPIADTLALKHATMHSFDSLLQVHPSLAQKNIVDAIEHRQNFVDRSVDFYLLLFLFVFLGLIRMSNPRYFFALLKAFWNPGFSNRQVKEQLQGAELPNLLMNIFFSIIGGGYLYYIINAFVPHRRSNMPEGVLLVLLVVGVLLIYSVKYLVIRFSGWVFHVQSITEEYIFNVFLINKIISVLLMPFIVLLAFGNEAWMNSLIIFSFILIALLWLNRYIRSWQIFGSFFQYSKFHFFTYLCASELLPLAVLVKLMIRGLLYY
jgi:hypothetical protein